MKRLKGILATVAICALLLTSIGSTLLDANLNQGGSNNGEVTILNDPKPNID